MMTKYVCKFKINGTTYEAISDRGIGVFKEGFWIDEDNELTVLSECKTWIPPHKIEYITKVA